MLVVYINTLEPVDLLDLGDDIVSYRLGAEYCKDIGWVLGAGCQLVSCLDLVALLDLYPVVPRNGVLLDLARLGVGYDYDS